MAVARPATKMVAAGLAAFAFWHLGQAAAIHGKAWLARGLVHYAWVQTIQGQKAQPVRPWPWADFWPVARLRVPRLDVDVVVLSAANGATLAFGPGHLAGSARPGHTGHSVISGHRDTHFRWLRLLRPGDRVVLRPGDGRRVVYEVTGTRVVDARRSRLRRIPEGRFLSLVTCYPFDAVMPGGPLRYVVRAHGV